MPGSRPRRFTRLRWVPALPSLTLVTPPPDPTSPPPPPDRGPAPAGARARAGSRRSDPAASSWCTAARVEREIGSMPGVFHLSVDESLDREVDRVGALGIPAVILFGLPAAKDDVGPRTSPRTASSSARSAGCASAIPICSSSPTSAAASTPATATAACCAARPVDNDATLEILGRVAVSHARAGADIVAPSGMMDGMVAAIRSALDAAGHDDRAILSYAVKYASGFYGPFREAAEQRAVVRRPAAVPDGPGEPPRGAARGGAGRGRRRRPAHGEAGPRLSRRGARGPGADPPSARWPTTSAASTRW